MKQLLTDFVFQRRGQLRVTPTTCQTRVGSFAVLAFSQSRRRYTAKLVPQRQTHRPTWHGATNRNRNRCHQSQTGIHAYRHTRIQRTESSAASRPIASEPIQLLTQRQVGPTATNPPTNLARYDQPNPTGAKVEGRQTRFPAKWVALDWVSGDPSPAADVCTIGVEERPVAAHTVRSGVRWTIQCGQIIGYQRAGQSKATGSRFQYAGPHAVVEYVCVADGGHRDGPSWLRFCQSSCQRPEQLGPHD